MAENYVLLETINLTQSTTFVTFDNLPSTGYTDLKVVMSARTTTNSFPDSYLQFNGDTTANYQWRVVYGTGAAAGSNNGGTTTSIAFGTLVGSSETANTFTNSEIYIPNYAGSAKKTVSIDAVTENNATTAYTSLVAGLWLGTSAITSIKLSTSATAYAAESTFSLYAIAQKDTTPVTAPFASGGNVIANDGTYWYHAFLSSGTFTPFKALTCDILQVAGGGGAGGNNGGGGGAGGLNYFASQSLTAVSNTVTVGAGGIAGDNSPRGQNGTNSQFGSLTAAVGGGGGGAYYDLTPGNGGSGGGGGGNADGQSASGGSPTSGQGFAGGNGQAAGNPNHRGGGGGGAGGVGANGNTRPDGGIGTSTYSSWGLATTTGQNSSGTVYYAGGGGGGASNTAGGNPGLGGGGQGGGATLQTAGQKGTGGGGGAQPNQGTGSSSRSQAGGSGIVIIRYAMV